MNTPQPTRRRNPNNPHHPRRARLLRRGGIIVVVLVIIAAAHLAVMGAIAPSPDDAQIAAFRVETSRAFYATDSCAMVCRKMLSSGVYTPKTGDTLTVGSSTASYLNVPPGDEDGDVIIEGRNGSAVRRIKVTLSH
ncbi:MAG: hypothetical protein IT435_10700 [Phycisphaerales bacterium]|nr:hypothetical protein [Phycisphaerales bacterium]